MDAKFRERMYDVLDLYQEPYDPQRPVLGTDEKPKQLLGEKRGPLPMKPGKPLRYDHEYVRNGKANIFVAVEPKAGRRITQVTDRRTGADFAKFVKKLVGMYPDAEVLRLVVDNLNTHNESSLYETFDKEEAERISSKIEFHYTPKHASWLNVAEVELAAMDAECTGRRIGSKRELAREVAACTRRRNRKRRKIDWRFTKKDADRKLSKHYT